MKRLKDLEGKENQSLFFKNRELNSQEFAEGKIILNSVPPNIFIQIDAPCNHDCIFCSRPDDYTFFNLDIFKTKFVEMFSIFELSQKIHLTGAGEFLLLPDADNILRFFDCEFPLSEKLFSTNGTTFTEESFDTLSNIRSKHTIQISLHASNPALHKRLVGKDDFNITIKNIEKLIRLREEKRNIDIFAMFLITTANIEELPNFLYLCKKLGIHRICCEYNSIYKLEQKELSCFFKQELTNSILEKVESLADSLDLEINLPVRFQQPPDRYNFRNETCSEPWTHVMVNFKGEVLPCCFFEGGTIGDISHEKFTKIWNNDIYQRLRMSILDNKNAVFCHNCIRNSPKSVNDIKGHLITRGKNEKEIGNLLNISYLAEEPKSEGPLGNNGYKEKKSDSRIRFVWRLNLACNYACPYCSVFFWGSERRLPEDKTKYYPVDEWVKHWDRIYDKYGSVEIHIVGGEPTAYPSFFELVLELSKRHYLGFDTNMSADFDAFAKKLDPSRFTFGIGASFHPSQAKFNEFMQKVELLAAARFKIWVNYVAYPLQLKQMAYFKTEVEKRGFNFVIQPFSGKYKGRIYPQSYAEKERNFIKSLTKGNKVLDENMEYQLDQKKVKGKLCYAGKKFAFIHGDGAIARCGEGPSEVIGNFFDKDFKMLDTPMPCNCETCYCEFKWLDEKQVAKNQAQQEETNQIEIELGIENKTIPAEKMGIKELIEKAQYYLQERKDLSIAKQFMRKAFSKQFHSTGMYSWALRVLARIYREEAELTQIDWVKEIYIYLACNKIEEALGIDREASWVNAEAANIYLVKGDTEKAKKLIKMALRKEPDIKYFCDIRDKIEQRIEGSEYAQNWLKQESGEYIPSATVQNRVVKEELFGTDIKKKLPPPYQVFYNWDIHYSCNYRCKYCLFDKDWNWIHQKNKYPGINKWIEIWNSMYEKYGECRVQISGGEPSTYPDFFELIGDISKKHVVEICTNLSYDVQRFTEIVRPERARINSAFHPQCVNLELFLKKAVYLREKGFTFSVTCVGYPANLKQLINIKKSIKEQDILFVLQPFRGEYEGRQYPEGYTEDEKNILKDLAGDFADNKSILTHHLSTGDNKNDGERLCRMGQMYGKIHPDGTVYRCCAIDDVEIVGNIIDNKDFKLLDEAAICKAKKCPCWKAMYIGKEENWMQYWK